MSAISKMLVPASTISPTMASRPITSPSNGERSGTRLNVTCSGSVPARVASERPSVRIVRVGGVVELFEIGDRQIEAEIRPAPLGVHDVIGGLAEGRFCLTELAAHDGALHLLEDRELLPLRFERHERVEKFGLPRSHLAALDDHEHVALGLPGRRVASPLSTRCRTRGSKAGPPAVRHIRRRR